MREIKFRAWDKEHGRMIENVGIQTGKNANSITISSEGIFIGNQCLSMILMQYTGLKDKNGKEIYEGDILDLPCGRVKVEFSDGLYGGFDGEGIIPFRKSVWGYGGGLIIGNIYDNPELLTS